VEVLKVMRESADESGTAVLFSTHNLHEVEQIADRAVIVDRGRVLADESLDRLRRGAGSSWSLEEYYLERVQ
jgi:ABC-2 type transport system ATP-binding protein